MKPIALAVLVALSFPAAAAADARPDRRSDHPAPPPMAAPVRQDLALRRLVDRYAEAAAHPAGRRRLPPLEAELARAFDRELAEARARLAAARREPRPGRGALAEARAQVERLASLREAFGQLQGRLGRRAVDRKEALARQLVVLASLEPGRPVPLPPPALAWRDGR
jgi:hypothetical protein